MSLFGTYLDVLRRSPALARLLAGEFVSGIGDWLYLVAVLVVVYAESSSPALLGIVGAARILPYVLLSVPAGIVADRFDRRRHLQHLAGGGVELLDRLGGLVGRREHLDLEAGGEAATHRSDPPSMRRPIRARDRGTASSRRARTTGS